MPNDVRWTIEDTVFISNSWQSMGKAIANKIEPRLGANFFTTLADATTQLADGVSGKATATGIQKSSTQELEKVMERTADMVSLMRAAFRRLFPKEKGLHAAVGVGNKKPLKGLPNLIEAADQMLEGLQRYPAFANTANVLPEDVDQLKALRAQLRAADGEQEAAKGARKQTTARVKSLHRDVINQLDQLYAAVMITHVAEKAVVDQWRKVIPTRRKKKT